MEPFIHITRNPEDLADVFALHLLSWISESVEKTFHLALSGGKTPALFFALLAGKYANKVPWEKLQFWWGDERMVKPSDPESNFGVANELLFSKISLSEHQLHRIIGESAPDIEALRYGSEIRSQVSCINGWPAFDLMMLGLGDDGHTASIFPDQLQLINSDKITEIVAHPTTGQQRITLTGKVLNHSKKIAFLCSGISKSGIFKDIIHQNQQTLLYPAFYIRPVGELHWFIDNACYGAT